MYKLPRDTQSRQYPNRINKYIPRVTPSEGPGWWDLGSRHKQIHFPLWDTATPVRECLHSPHRLYSILCYVNLSPTKCCCWWAWFYLGEMKRWERKCSGMMIWHFHLLPHFLPTTPSPCIPKSYTPERHTCWLTEPWTHHLGTLKLAGCELRLCWNLKLSWYPVSKYQHSCLGQERGNPQRS